MYVDMFSKSLDLECRGGGITVQNMAPGFVATKLAKIRHASLEAPSPATWAAAAVRHIGYEVTSSPYWCALLARRTRVQERSSRGTAACALRQSGTHVMQSDRHVGLLHA